MDLHAHTDQTYTVDEVGEAPGDLRIAIASMQAAREKWMGERGASAR